MTFWLRSVTATRSIYSSRNATRLPAAARLVSCRRQECSWFSSSSSAVVEEDDEPREAMAFDVLIVGGGPSLSLIHI